MDNINQILACQGSNYYIPFSKNKLNSIDEYNNELTFELNDDYCVLKSITLNSNIIIIKPYIKIGDDVHKIKFEPTKLEDTDDLILIIKCFVVNISNISTVKVKGLLFLSNTSSISLSNLKCQNVKIDEFFNGDLTIKESTISVLNIQSINLKTIHITNSTITDKFKCNKLQSYQEGNEFYPTYNITLKNCPCIFKPSVDLLMKQDTYTYSVETNNSTYNLSHYNIGKTEANAGTFSDNNSFTDTANLSYSGFLKINYNKHNPSYWKTDNTIPIFNKSEILVGRTLLSEIKSKFNII